MGTYAENERSALDGEPLELFEFIGPTTTWRYASGTESKAFNGFQYEALAGLVRSGQGISSSKDTAALLVELPVTSSLVQNYGFAIAPKSLRLKVYRLQVESGEYRISWDGAVLSFTPKGRLATARSVSALGERLETNIPSVSIQRQCNHFLGDRRCRVDIEALAHSTLVASASGLTVTLASAPGNGQAHYYRAGKIVRLVDGEERTIVAQQGAGAVFTMSSPFREIANGDSVRIYPGCAHDIVTCNAKFGNKDNFGGHPSVPSSNPFLTSIKLNG